MKEQEPIELGPEDLPTTQGGQPITVMGGRAIVVGPNKHIWDLVPDDEAAGGQIKLPDGVYDRKVPQWIIDPEEMIAYPIKMYTVPEEKDEFGFVKSYEHEEPDKILEAHGQCPACGKRDAQYQGYWLDTRHPTPNAVVQCQTCGAYHWIVAGKKDA
jgi:hypothetical protein